MNSNITTTTIQFLLVNNPAILNFSWNQGQTFGSSQHFPYLTVLSYLIFTFLLSRIPKHTLSPNPRMIKPITAIHSLILIILSIIMAAGCSLSTISQSPNLHWVICFPKNTPAKGPIFFWGYIFYLSKILEFLDTFMIILSGSTQRLSFLHVYHHALAVIVCYLWLNTSQSLFPVGIIANSLVHVLMYTYYFLCSLGVHPKWKKMVTTCQIIQLSFSFVVFGIVLLSHLTTPGGCSGILSWSFNIIFCASLLVLFCDFYVRNYLRMNEKKANKIA